MTDEHVGVSDVIELRLNGVIIGRKSLLHQLYNWVISIINNR